MERNISIYPYTNLCFTVKIILNDNQRSHFIDRITNREDLIIAIILIFSLIILIINTWLCQRYIDEKVILQRKKPKSDEYYLKRLGINAWKFTPESRFLLLNIVRIDDEIVRVDNEDDEVESVYNGETDKIRVVDNDKNDDIIIKISFNAKSDVMIQTNYPLFNINKALNMQYPPPIEYWFYYYEITILSNPNNDQTIIAIGLATKNYSINRLPGCDTHSVGFHSDEGRTFHNEGYTGSKYAEKWGNVDDVIGCGYCPNTGQIFFTMNGKNLGIAYTSLFYNWYPTIGSNGFCSLNVNFGQKKFKYKEANGMSVAGIISQELLNKVEEIIDIDKLN
ncbi:SPRY-domain-containing protein [Rhizophagus irregularis]|uniref:SPRY-domain-containing protein n=1 Tax=Rhizophagus irregularis TaxID=588596 RepID=A0A2N1N592_9GLOM|nr:SPRY-domain-containing protein [Rhizophagus irregularis]